MLLIIETVCYEYTFKHVPSNAIMILGNKNAPLVRQQARLV